MNKLVAGIVVLVIIVAAAFYLKSGSTQQNSLPTPTMSTMPSQSPMASPNTKQSANSVMIANFAFSPSTLTVKVGDTVTWTNQDNVGHSATADDGTFDTGILDQGKSGSFTFTKAGTYKYHCSVHPNMHGTIIVQ